MANTKNPTALFMQRMAMAGKGSGSMAGLLQKFFADNYGKTDLPKRVADFVIYDQIAVNTLQTANFFQGTYSTNRTNFPGGSFIMPQSEHAVITGIRVLEGTNAAVQSTAWNYGVRDAVTLNGELTVTSNGETILTQLPLTAFQSNVDLNAAAGTPSFAGETDDNAGFFYFMEPLVLLGQTDIKSNIQFKAAVATANLNLRVELHGIRFIGG